MINSIILPSTDLKLSRLAYGTGSLHHVFSPQGRQALLEAAFEIGVTHFDTAPYYGFGLAESALGEFIKTHRGKVTVATKFGLYPPNLPVSGTLGTWASKALGKVLPAASSPRVDWGLAAAEKSLNLSLKRLGVDCIDLLFMHEPNPALMDVESLYTWLTQQQQRGKIRYFGLAGPAQNYSDWLLGNPLGQVLQVQDSLAGREADLLTQKGRAWQLSYGYFSGAKPENEADARDTLQGALARNHQGTILFSSRKVSRIKSFAQYYKLALL